MCGAERASIKLNILLGSTATKLVAYYVWFLEHRSIWSVFSVICNCIPSTSSNNDRIFEVNDIKLQAHRTIACQSVEKKNEMKFQQRLNFECFFLYCVQFASGAVCSWLGHILYHLLCDCLNNTQSNNASLNFWTEYREKNCTWLAIIWFESSTVQCIFWGFFLLRNFVVVSPLHNSILSIRLDVAILYPTVYAICRFVIAARTFDATHTHERCLCAPHPVSLLIFFVSKWSMFLLWICQKKWAHVSRVQLDHRLNSFLW